MDGTQILHAVLFVTGMVLHGFVRWYEWKKATPESTSYLDFLLRRDFVTAQVLSVLVLMFWLSDMDMGGFKLSDYVPFRPAVGLVLGYLADSLTKHLVKVIPFLKPTS